MARQLANLSFFALATSVAGSMLSLNGCNLALGLGDLKDRPLDAAATEDAPGTDSGPDATTDRDTSSETGAGDDAPMGDGAEPPTSDAALDAPSPDSGPCEAGGCGCPVGKNNCGGTCVDETLNGNCGGCGVTCGSSARYCNAGTCTAVRPSCRGLAATCGKVGGVGCCSTSVIPAGTFNRSNNPNYPATLSAFALDTYEVSVGRFRKFVAGYPGNKPLAGSGKNPHNASDPGWDAVDWNPILPADAPALIAAAKCGMYQTWTDTPGNNEAVPMTCINWYVAYAFCIWDGGRLPTEAEWNYAAAGGSDQRQYPWGATGADCNHANYSLGSGNGSCSANQWQQTGYYSPVGDAKWGQADMAGNVWEWVLDAYVSPYASASCTDCANTTDASRGLLGGSYLYDTSFLQTTARGGVVPSGSSYDVGARCAVAP